ncbi:hypothetical protein Tco_1264168 [Tanacetum coccineum]
MTPRVLPTGHTLSTGMGFVKDVLVSRRKNRLEPLIDVYDGKVDLRGWKWKFNIYSGSPTISSDDSFPSSSPVKTSDSTTKEFHDGYALFINSFTPGGDDVSS